MTLLAISMNSIRDGSDRTCLAVDRRTDIPCGEMGVMESEGDFGLTDLSGEALEPTIWRGTGAGPPEMSDQLRLHGTLQFMRASFGTADDIDGEIVWSPRRQVSSAVRSRCNRCVKRVEEEEEEEEFITSGNWSGKHNSLSRGAGAGH